MAALIELDPSDIEEMFGRGYQIFFPNQVFVLLLERQPRGIDAFVSFLMTL